MAFIVGSVLIGAGASVLGGAMASKGAKDAAKTAAAGSDREIAFNRESRDLARADQAPYREAGYKALNALMSMTGLGGGPAPAPTGQPTNYSPFNPLARAVRQYADDQLRSDGPSYLDARSVRNSAYIQPRYAGGNVAPNYTYQVNEMGPENLYLNGAVTRNPNPMAITGQDGYVQENPGGVEGGYNFMTDPGYQFRFEEGQRALDRGAAARGGLLSGGYGRRAIRYGQGFASNEYTNVYNRIANIAGLGQVAGQQSGQSSMYGSALMGNAAGNRGYAQASGYAAQGDIWGNALGNLGDIGLDWWNNRTRATTPSAVPIGRGA